MNHKRYEQNIAYAAKQLLTLAKEQGKTSFGLTSSRGLGELKNKNAADLARCIAKAGQKVLLVDFDETSSGQEAPGLKILRAYDKIDGLSYHVQPGEFGAGYDLVLYNLLPVLEHKAMLDKKMFFDGIVLTAKYGKTYYSDLEAALSLLKENDVPIAGVLANR